MLNNTGNISGHFPANPKCNGNTREPCSTSIYYWIWCDNTRKCDGSALAACIFASNDLGQYAL